MMLAEYKSLLPEPVESVNCIKKYGFIESHKKGKWQNGFTEIRKLGKWRYAIKSTMANTYSVTNTEDMEGFVKYYLRLNGY